MARLSRIALIVGIVGGIATYFGVMDVVPMTTWAGVAVVGAVLTLIFRRPSD